MASPGISATGIAAAVPYRRKADLERLVAGLRGAGMPD
jgi:hypothetical protein